jgi:N-glycosylase/DNA lyase
VEQQKEFMFCTLTPQSNAQRCWSAVEEIFRNKELTETNIREVLKTRTRFHNNKTRYILKNKVLWNNIGLLLNNTNILELRNWLADNVKGYGLKEASHFLRNVGKSNNQIAILDRHILKNLKKHNLIQETKIKSRKDYLEKEAKYLEFAHKTSIPADELDLLWWSQENGSIFK